MPHNLSLRRQLLVGLLSTVILVTAATTWLAYQSAKTEVNRLFDASLTQEAIVLAELLNHEADEEIKRTQLLQKIRQELGNRALIRSPSLATMIKNDRHTADRKDYIHLISSEHFPQYPYQASIHYFARYPSGQIMVRSPGTDFFETHKTGVETLHRQGKSWRVYSFILPDTHLMVQLSEPMDVRTNSVNSWLNATFWPLFVMIPLLGFIIWLSVGNSMKRLHRVADLLKNRDPYSLELISVRQAPQEIVPLLSALNHLFIRVEAALHNEHEFTSNAAHEIRNPLAALKTRIQSFQIQKSDAQQNNFLHELINGVDRISHLLEQMLILARADARQRQDLQQKIDLYHLSEEVLAEHAHDAIDKYIDLSLQGSRQIIIGDTEALRILLGNLIDNAIKYTQPGGKISVAVTCKAQHTEFSIEDNGPGIPPEQREALFQRFKRGEKQHITSGSGLGLSIIRRIAELHTAAVILQTPKSGHGLLVRVIF